ncbi:diguanylate cyclase response regulator [Pseudoalteromonas luteoviolacea]|uniref:diguanylate cyclase n=1 Tax=Pseudoalteromonas luteoviolacea TaxID=43657 RepID=A0A1C0TPC0_9GAMM|nr:diguanylate cyclase [Pseudoalteromonas luteoviolacea]MBQ4811747.1 diguanylate cyclase [Pseudoalteromonas luteoviolacea]OCQ20789.1 diguanylate cyclase response regulator [Pseudoalteromonas luteoviolacea]
MQKSANILVLDGDPLNRVVLENTLSEDHLVISCSSSDQAFERLLKTKFDLIIVDILMPDDEGLDFLLQLKADPMCYQIPVIVISASNSYQDEARGLMLGAVDYIVKPFSPNIVKARVKIHLAIKQKNDLLERLANIDGLTEVPNRRALDETLAQLWYQSRDQHVSLSILLVDIDYFKEFNDACGYSAGDECLVKVAKALESITQRVDGFVARYDGVRFVALVNKRGAEQALALASAMHQAVDALEIPHPCSPICAHVTISVGVVHVSDDFSGDQTESLVEADEALVKAHQLQERVVLVNR